MAIPKVSERAKYGSPKFLPDHGVATRLQQGTLAEREAEAKAQGISEIPETAPRDQEPHMGAVCFNCGGPLGKSKKYQAYRASRSARKPHLCPKCAYEARERMYEMTGKKRGGRSALKIGDKCKNGHGLTEKNTRTLKATATRGPRTICITCETINREKYLAKKAKEGRGRT